MQTRTDCVNQVVIVKECMKACKLHIRSLHKHDD